MKSRPPKQDFLEVSRVLTGCDERLLGSLDPMQIECQFLEELLEAAKDALDKRVTVSGTRPTDQSRRPKSLLVSRLEIIEDREE